MANAAGRGNLQKVQSAAGLGKSTLVTSPKLSVPMPSGAALPPAHSGQSRSQSGQAAASSGSKGSKNNG
jgi:hypothetical protein